MKALKNNKDELLEKYSKKEYTGRKKYLYNIIVSGTNVFFYNPLNNLETYKKYDIIREGGQIFKELSQRFPVYFWRQCFAEIKYTDARYQKEEAQKLLNERFGYYLKEQEENGYKIIEARLSVQKAGERYIARSDVKVQKEQVIYNKLNTKKGMKKNGNNGNNNRDTSGT